MSYVYFICKRIDTNSFSLTDFIGKIGKGTKNRYKNHKTQYGNYTTYIWDTEHETTVEDIIKLWLELQGWLKYHKSNRCTEILHIPVTLKTTMKEAIDTYNERCVAIIEKIVSITNTLPRIDGNSLQGLTMKQLKLFILPVETRYIKTVGGWPSIHIDLATQYRTLVNEWNKRIDKKEKTSSFGKCFNL